MSVGVHNEAEAIFNQLLTKPKTKMFYEYDFGDNWEHEILFEKIIALVDSKAIQCIKGKRAAPPEGCGGAYGYAYLLEILADKKHPEHKEMRQLVGRDFDPEKFDLVKINRVLSA